MSEKNAFEYVILALDTLIGDPDIINPGKDTPKIADNLVVPNKYLDKFFEIYYEQSTRGDAAKQCMDILDRHMRDSDKRHEVELANGTTLHIFDSKKRANNDTTSQQAINTAKEFKEKYKTKGVAIMTGSGRLAPIVRTNNIDVLEISYDIYTGRRRLELPYEYSNEWYSNHKISPKLFAEMFPDEPPLRANEFVEFKSGPEDIRTSGYGFAYIGRYDLQKEALVPLKYTNKLPYGIYPSNAGQAMLTEALMTPPDELPIVIVPGTFGTGKTFLTLAAGLVQTEGNGHKAIYDRIFICPRDSYLGREHGYLKGDLMEKLMPLLGPFKDNLREIIKKKGPDASKYRDKQIEARTKQPRNKNRNGPEPVDTNPIDDKIEWYFTESPYFEFEAVINMGGRSINDSFIIFDEFQDMERGQAKALLTRIGNGSKNVIMGDPSQFTNPHLSRTSNGLVYASNIFSNYEGAAVITMFPDECVRSAAGQAISAIFSGK